MKFWLCLKVSALLSEGKNIKSIAKSLTFCILNTLSTLSSKIGILEEQEPPHAPTSRQSAILGFTWRTLPTSFPPFPTNFFLSSGWHKKHSRPFHFNTHWPSFHCRQKKVFWLRRWWLSPAMLKISQVKLYTLLHTARKALVLGLSFKKN